MTGIIFDISALANIETPNEPGFYDLYMWTDEEPLPANIEVFITDKLGSGDTQVQNLLVSLSNSLAGKTSGYQISFRNSNESFLSFQTGDFVDIVFPKEVILPSIPNPSLILLNLGTPSKVEINKNILRVYMPESWFISPGAECIINIYDNFGIINPELAGKYAIQVATSKDTKFSFKTFEVTGNLPILYSFKIDPANQEFPVSFSIKFRTSENGSLEAKVGKVFIKLPYDFSVPSFIKIESVNIVTGGKSLQPEKIEVSKGILKITVPTSIPGNADVEIRVLESAGIKNPTDVGIYSVGLATSSDAQFVNSWVEIIKSKISNVNVKLIDDTTGRPSNFKITFKTGKSGNLTKGDVISIIIPKDFLLPKEIIRKAILINNNYPSNVSVVDNTVEIEVDNEIQANSIVEIQILPESGIYNPKFEKYYSFYIFTNKEMEKVQSNMFQFRNPPETKMTIIPEKPDGENGFYITQPLIKFVITSSVDQNPVLYYYVDEPPAKKLESLLLKIPEGVHTIYYYGVDYNGRKEETRKVSFKVDTIPPKIDIIEPLNNSSINTTKVTFKGNLSELATLTINGESVALDPSNNFEKTIQLKEGLNEVIFAAVDLAGNTSSTTIRVTVDTIPPKIEVSNLKNNQVISNLPFKVLGKTEPGCRVFVNDEEIPIFADGSFFFYIENIKQGNLNISVSSFDQAQNKSSLFFTVYYSTDVKIVLKVGSKYSLVNGNEVKLDVAPVIISNRTMVPVRFIAEAFGAKVSYDPTSKTVSIVLNEKRITLKIGSNIAKVNDIEIKIDVSPVIIDGRTFVPLRFVSEILGAEVNWDKDTKTVIIIYKLR
ncbi:MAG: copper amine oxidase N-terminal domain-containing protein [Candidatus Parvarchaeota archaeon]|nr:copper amine oxidase N-terminal domain-containing protein [Candidatus Jingweiarchaeum tengchongense]